MHLKKLALFLATSALLVGRTMLAPDGLQGGIAQAAESSHGSSHESGSASGHSSSGSKGKGHKQFMGGGKGHAGHSSGDDGHKGSSSHAGGSKMLEAEIMNAEESHAGKKGRDSEASN